MKWENHSFNQDLTCSLLGEQRSVKWHNSLKVQVHTHTSTQRKDHKSLICASPVHYLLQLLKSGGHTCTHTKMETAGDVSTCNNLHFVPISYTFHIICSTCSSTITSFLTPSPKFVSSVLTFLCNCAAIKSLVKDSAVVRTEGLTTAVSTFFQKPHKNREQK